MSQDSPNLGKFEYLEKTEQQRSAIRSVVFGETKEYPAIKKAFSILDGDYSYTSNQVKSDK